MQHFSFGVHVLKSFILAAVMVVAAGITFAVPQSASAYSTTAQSVTQLTDNTFLFQVTYRFNFLNREARVPILATRTNSVDTSSSQVQYSLRNSEGDLVTTGASTAIVLSETSIEAGEYSLLAGTPGLFTLMVIVQLPDEAVTTGGEAALQIDWLPFTLIHDGEVQRARLPEADVAMFKTPTITW